MPRPHNLDGSRQKGAATAQKQERRSAPKSSVQIIKANPDLGLYNTHGGQGGGRSALTVAAERGDLEVLEVVYEGAVKARGEAFARQFLNAGAERGQTPLMRACVFGTPQHVECVGYLLRKGADPFAETEKGETCLHLAAKNAYTECLSEILAARVSIGGGPPTRLADFKLPYTPPVKFVDMRNAAGFTPLHLATLKNSPAAMQVLLGAGASMDAGISDAGNTPHLAKGSTALHIAAARGSQPCCSVLLDFQSSVQGMELRRIRNQRGLKASQLARLAGHDGLALILSERQGGGRRSGRGRRRRRATRDALHTQGGGPRPASSPDAVLNLLVQRARLLLALREVGLHLDSQAGLEPDVQPVKAAMLAQSKGDSTEQREVKDDIAVAVAEFTDLWKKGELEVASDRANSVLSALTHSDAPVSALPDEVLNSAEHGEDTLAAAAMVQAALNAMAYFSPVAKPLDLPPTELKPTSPVAAAMVVQAAIRKLAGKGGGHASISTATLLHSIAQTGQQSQHTADRSSDLASGAATPPPAEHRHRKGGRRLPHTIHTTPLPHRPDRELANGAGNSSDQVRRILSKARRRQKQTALKSADVAGRGPGDENAGPHVRASGAQPDTAFPAVRPLLRGTADEEMPSAEDEEAAHNPLMDNPLFPNASAALGPGERRRAMLRQAALQTAPQMSRDPKAQPFFSDHPDAAQPGRPGPEPLLHKRTPFQADDGPAAGPLPPAFPWESYTSAEAAAPGIMTFSSNMPSSQKFARTHGKPSWTPPRTPTRADARGDALSDSQSHSHSGQCSPVQGSRRQTEREESLLSQEGTSNEGSRRRLKVQALETPVLVSGSGTDSFRGSKLLRTDSIEATTSHLSPHASEPPFSHDSCSDYGDEDEDGDEDSDNEGKPETANNESRCAICMDQPLQVGIATCEHLVCYGCAYQLCSRGLSAPNCPFCRGAIKTFTSAPSPLKQDHPKKTGR